MGEWSGMSEPRDKKLPFPELPQRRPFGEGWGRQAAVLAALASLGLVALVVVRQTEKKQQTQALLMGAPPPSVVASRVRAPAEAPAPVADRMIQQPERRARPEPATPVPVMAADARQADRFERATNLFWSHFLAADDTQRAATLRKSRDAWPRLLEWEKFGKLTPAMPMEVGPKYSEIGPFLITTIKMPDGRSRMIAAEDTEEGMKLDWESFSGFGDCRLADLKDLDRGRQVLLRVEVGKAEREAPFLDDRVLSFALKHPDQDTVVHAHTDRQDLEKTRAGRTLLSAGGGLFIVRIEIGDATAESGWVRLVAVETAGWIDGMPIPALLEDARTASL